MRAGVQRPCQALAIEDKAARACLAHFVQHRHCVNRLIHSSRQSTHEDKSILLVALLFQVFDFGDALHQICRVLVRVVLDRDSLGSVERADIRAKRVEIAFDHVRGEIYEGQQSLGRYNKFTYGAVLDPTDRIADLRLHQRIFSDHL